MEKGGQKAIRYLVCFMGFQKNILDLYASLDIYTIYDVRCMIYIYQFCIISYVCTNIPSIYTCCTMCLQDHEHLLVLNLDFEPHQRIK